MNKIFKGENLTVKLPNNIEFIERGFMKAEIRPVKVPKHCCLDKEPKF